MKEYRDRSPLSLSGYLAVILFAACVFFALRSMLSLTLIYNFDGRFDLEQLGLMAAMAGLVVVGVTGVSGFYIVQPNTARVLTFLGNYVGTDARSGLRWTVPFLITKTPVTQRLNNFESGRSKVNDATGNPIEISGIVVWRVISPASSVFGVNDVADYVETQSEAAIRALAGSYPYGSARHNERGEVTLLNNPDEIALRLRENLQERVEAAGVEIIEARLSYLAYATEIAAAMLQRQQADALVDAREVIVEGAVGIVEIALKRLEEGGSVQLDASARAQLATNLLVVLSSDQAAQPVLPVGESSRAH